MPRSGSPARPHPCTVILSGRTGSAWDLSYPNLTNVTFTGNSVTNTTSGHGGAINGYNNHIVIHNSILWGNTAALGLEIYQQGNQNTNIIYSVVAGGCPANGICAFIYTADPRLGALGNYGGFTQTVPLLPGSQAIETEITCDKCGQHKMVIKWGRNGEFLACPGYPECRNTMNFRREDGNIVPEKEEDVAVEDKCPECGADMVMKRGRFGRFLACTRYPDCKGTKPVSIGVTCPKECGGYISEKRSRRGKTFYGCSSYPKCDFVSWDRPRNEACPQCGSAYLVDKFSKKTGAYVACPNKECGYRRDAEARSGEAVEVAKV